MLYKNFFIKKCYKNVYKKYWKNRVINKLLIRRYIHYSPHLNSAGLYSLIFTPPNSAGKCTMQLLFIPGTVHPTLSKPVYAVTIRPTLTQLVYAVTICPTL